MGNTDTGPKRLYLDACVLRAIVKGQLSSADADAMAQMGAWVAESKLTVLTSTVMKEELDAIHEPYRGPHLEAYHGLREITGHPTTVWLDEESSGSPGPSGTLHPTFARLTKALPDRNDARRIFQAARNDVRDFVTVNERAIINRAHQVLEAAAVRVWSPATYVSGASTA